MMQNDIQILPSERFFSRSRELRDSKYFSFVICSVNWLMGCIVGCLVRYSIGQLIYLLSSVIFSLSSVRVGIPNCATCYHNYDSSCYY